MYDVEQLAKLSAAAIKRLTPTETEVFETILDYLDTLPGDFFESNTVDELNKHFGGHDDMVVTENVRNALDLQKKFEDTLDEMADVVGELPEDDPEDEEEE